MRNIIFLYNKVMNFFSWKKLQDDWFTSSKSLEIEDNSSLGEFWGKKWASKQKNDY